MSSVQRSSTSSLNIRKGNKVVSISPDTVGPKTVKLEYFESLLSPIVTANMVVVDAADGDVPTSREQNIQGKPGSVLSSLPITGNETVDFVIENESGRLDLSRYPLRVDAVASIGKESERESYAISLVSGYSYQNQATQLYKKYQNQISDTVTKILKDYFGVGDDRLKVDTTKFPYKFAGSGRDPFKIILNLASKSVPSSSKDPGYFFYETKEGFNFRAISELITQEPLFEYKETNVITDNDPENSFRIISSQSIRDQSLMSALKSGVFSSKNIFFNPKTFKYEQINVSLDLEKYLGKDIEIPEEFYSTSRVHEHILDIGSLDNTVVSDANNDPREWQAKSSMRYNFLFSQIRNITVPCNVNLSAGDTINCYFPYATRVNKTDSPYDQHISGKYLILNLCHEFDFSGGGQSYTYMTLVRDTYGLYTNKNKA